MKPVARKLIYFRARFMMFEIAEVRKWRCHTVGVEILRFVLRRGSHEHCPVLVNGTREAASHPQNLVIPIGIEAHP